MFIAVMGFFLTGYAVFVAMLGHVPTVDAALVGMAIFLFGLSILQSINCKK